MFRTETLISSFEPWPYALKVMLNIVISLGLELVAGELCYHSCRMASRNGFLVLAEIDLDMDDIMLKHSLIFRIEGP